MQTTTSPLCTASPLCAHCLKEVCSTAARGQHVACDRVMLAEETLKNILSFPPAKPV